MSATLLPVRQGTPARLEFRRTGIGSSDAPVIAGERGSLVALWAEKAGLVKREPVDAATQRLFDRGHRLEPVVAAWYTDETGRPLRSALQRTGTASPWIVPCATWMSGYKRKHLNRRRRRFPRTWRFDTFRSCQRPGAWLLADVADRCSRPRCSTASPSWVCARPPWTSASMPCAMALRPCSPGNWEYP
jgi:hypothetical protein